MNLETMQDGGTTESKSTPPVNTSRWDTLFDGSKFILVLGWIVCNVVARQTTSTVTSTVTIGASYCFTTKKLFFGALTPRCGRNRGKRAIDVDPIPGSSGHRNRGDVYQSIVG